jgi:two-component system OmpR family sensor kinase
MRSVPIRLRLTFAFAFVMAAVLAAMGAFVYTRVDHELVSTVDQGLRFQAREGGARLASGGGLVEHDENENTLLAQLFDAQGGLLRSTLPAGATLLDPAAIALALRGESVLQTIDIGSTGDWRVLATPIRIDGHTDVLVLARSLQARQESLHHLAAELLIAGPIALALASLAGYLLAGAALRPVETMRRRARAITGSTPGRRLPVPPARDEISRLAVTLNEMLARLEAAFEHERRFVADASHELRTPLALLRTELELALRRPRGRGELEAALRSAASETERLSRLAEDLLLVARADQGRLPVRTEVQDVAELFGEVAERFEGRAGELGRSIRISPDEPVAVEADPARLQQALGNLVENALVHGAGTVMLSTQRAGGLVELHVTDSGPGFPETFVGRAFDRFSRADEARARGGTGLGLSIVELIADAHGGAVGAENRPGGGADVWIAVPAASAPVTLAVHPDLMLG